MSTGITLAEYNRRWDLIMRAFVNGYFTPEQASAAVRELTQQIVWRC